MSNENRISGPTFLEELADRQQAGGFMLEAEMLRERAREWSLDKQAIENGTPAPAAKPENTKAFNATLIETVRRDQRTCLVLQPEGTKPRPLAVQYHCIPIAS